MYATYIHTMILISWKIPFKWIWYCVLSDIFYGELPSKYVIYVARSCVDFVLPKLFPCINIVFELLRDRKWKVTQYGCLWKRYFWGVAIRSAILVATTILISWKILFKWIWYCVLSDIFTEICRPNTTFIWPGVV